MQLEMSNTLTITFFPPSNNSSWNLRGTLLPQHCGKKMSQKIETSLENRMAGGVRNSETNDFSARVCSPVWGFLLELHVTLCSSIVQFWWDCCSCSQALKIYGSILWQVCLLPQSLHSFPSIFSAKKVLWTGCDLQTHHTITKHLRGIISPSW